MIVSTQLIDQLNFSPCHISTKTISSIALKILMLPLINPGGVDNSDLMLIEALKLPEPEYHQIAINYTVNKI